VLSGALPFDRLRVYAGMALVLAQLGAVVFAHVDVKRGAARYFAWAPNDYSVDYSIRATVNGHLLDAREFGERYRLPERDFYEDPPQRLLHYLRRYESTYGRHDRTSLVVRYRLDGHRPVVWRWSHG